MADSQAANIGANFSNYQGNPGLGGFGLGAGRIDTGPLMDLAKYAMLYNREEYLQRQKAKEKAAEELVKYTSLDLSTTIPKDAKILQDKFDELHNYIKANPEALDYNNRDKWLEYNKKKADLMNDIKFAKLRSIANVARKEAIAATTNEEEKKFLEQGLQKNISDTDIRTPLDFDQKYDLEVPDIPVNNGIAMDVTKAGSNQIFQRGFTVFDVKQAERNGALQAQGIKVMDSSTVKGSRQLMRAKENPWIIMSTKLNEAIAGAPKDANGNVDATALDGVPGMELVTAWNEYAKNMRASIAAGETTDKFGNKISFVSFPFKAEDYKDVNINDGIDAKELGVIAQFGRWGGDKYDTNVVQTDDAIQQRGLNLEAARLAESQRQFDLNYGNESTDVRSGAYSILSTIQNAISKGTRFNINVGTSGTGTPVGSGAIEIDDIALINQTKGIAKDGTTTEAANKVLYYPDTKKFELIYYKKDDDGNIVRGGSGGGIIDSDKTKTLSTSNWVESMIGDRYDAKTKGRINNVVTSEIDKFKGDLVDFSKNFNISTVPLEEEGKKEKTEKTIKGKSGKTIFVPE